MILVLGKTNNTYQECIISMYINIYVNSSSERNKINLTKLNIFYKAYIININFREENTQH